MTKITEGKDLMLYANIGGTVEAPTWKASAAATSHKISNKSDVKERITKDSSGLYSEKRVTKNSVTITVDALVSVDPGFGYKELLAMQKEGTPVLLKYGNKTEVTGDTYEQGLFVITALDQDAPAEGDATYSCTFENSGAVETKTKEA